MPSRQGRTEVATTPPPSLSTRRSGAGGGEPGAGSFGFIQSGALETSNVEITEELVSLITAQRSFQANAQVISAADTVTQTVINIGR